MTPGSSRIGSPAQTLNLREPVSPPLNCPECNASKAPDAAACLNCGLLFVALKQPKRRLSDFIGERRRSIDPRSSRCPLCKGEVEPDAIRCRHCSEVIDPNYRLERALKLRSHVNRASWIAYLLGLVTLFLFRPVGLISIGAGLVLSILYYLIPVEETSPGSDNTKGSAVSTRGSASSRFSLNIPRFPKLKVVFVGTPLLAALIGYAANFVLLQKPLDEILASNKALSGIDVSAHFKYWVIPGVVVYDLRSVEKDQNRLAVHTAFAEYAKRLKARDVDEVELQYRGSRRFVLDGKDFREIGENYEARNFDAVLESLPARVHRAGNVDPSASEGSGDSGGTLIEFHDDWYARDEMKRSLASSPERPGQSISIPIRSIQ